MTSAREINEKLDEIIRHNREREAVELDYTDPDFTLEDANTGKKVTKEMVLNKADEVYELIIEDLNKLTHSGQHCRDMFTNDYYVNDFSQDKIIAREIRENKMKAELAKQKAENN